MKVLFCGEELFYSYIYTSEALQDEQGIQVLVAVYLLHKGSDLQIYTFPIDFVDLLGGKVSTVRSENPHPGS